MSQLLSESRSQPTRRLSFVSDADDPFVHYAQHLFADRYRVEMDLAAARSMPVDVYHGNDRNRPSALRIPLVPMYKEASVPLPRDFVAPEDAGAGAPFPFDVFAATRFWMADEANRDAPSEAFDHHDRLTGEGSAQGRLGLLPIPIVNAYFELLRSWLAHRCGAAGRLSLPGGRSAVVLLSHDADGPINPADPTHASWRALQAVRAGKAKAAGRHVGSALVRLARGAASLGRGPRHWVFRELMEAEDRFGFRSTTFFSARSRSDPFGTIFDENYDIRAPRFRRLLDELVSGGWEVGLHLSYRARESVHRMAAERRRLGEAAGVHIFGNRHHYWHMGRSFWKTLERHAQAGFAYDSSIAFDEVAGYRLGFAFPCELWSPELRAPVGALQVPTVLMDSSYFYRGEPTVEDMLQHFDGILTSLKQYRGVAGIDWHSRFSVPMGGRFDTWGAAYLALLEMLAGDPDVAVMSYSQFLGFDQASSRPDASG